MVFQKRETFFGFVLKIGDVVERSKQHLLEDVFLMKYTSEKKTRHFMTSSTKGNLRDSTFKKKHLRDFGVFVYNEPIWL